MPQIPVPGVAQLVFSGTKSTQPWACVTHWKYDLSTAPWTQTNIQLLADTFSNLWGTVGAGDCSAATIMNSVTTTDLTSSAAVVGSNTTSHAGTHAGAELVTSAATVLSFRIPARYRGGHPRIYLPWGSAADMATEFSWGAAWVTKAANDWVSIVSQLRTTLPTLGGNQVSHVAPTYTYTYAPNASGKKIIKTRTALKQVYIVASYITNPTLGTQRRRLVTG